MSELFTKRNVAVTLTALAATAALASCARPGHEAGNNNHSTSADGSTAPDGSTQSTPPPNLESSAAATANPNPESSDDGTGGTGDHSKVEQPRSPLVFVIAPNAGGTALFGCERLDSTHIITFGRDYVEGKVKGRTIVTAGQPAKPQPDVSATQLQAEANTHPEKLLTGTQTLGSGNSAVTVDCGRPVDLNNTGLLDISGQTISANEVQPYQPAVGHVNDQNLTIIQTHA